MSNVIVYVSGATVQVMTSTAVPAYPADARPVIQAALSSVDVNRGGQVSLSQGRYKAGGLTSTIQGLDFRGDGMPGLDTATCKGSTQIVVPDGMDGLTLGTLATHGARGYGARGIHFIADAAAGNGRGIVILNAENDILDDLSISDFVAGVGLDINGGGGNAQYITARNLRISNCGTGLRMAGPVNGFRLQGGYFAGYPPSATAPASRRGTGISMEGGDTLMVTDAIFQTWQTCIDIRKNTGHKVDARFENFGTAVRIGGLCKGVFITGCFTNGGTAVYVEAGARNIKFSPRYLSPDVMTPFTVEEPHPSVQMVYP